MKTTKLENMEKKYNEFATANPKIGGDFPAFALLPPAHFRFNCAAA